MRIESNRIESNRIELNWIELNWMVKHKTCSLSNNFLGTAIPPPQTPTHSNWGDDDHHQDHDNHHQDADDDNEVGYVK